MEELLRGDSTKKNASKAGKPSADPTLPDFAVPEEAPEYSSEARAAIKAAVMRASGSNGQELVSGGNGSKSGRKPGKKNSKSKKRKAKRAAANIEASRHLEAASPEKNPKVSVEGPAAEERRLEDASTDNELEVSMEEPAADAAAETLRDASAASERLSHSQDAQDLNPETPSEPDAELLELERIVAEGFAEVADEDIRSYDEILAENSAAEEAAQESSDGSIDRGESLAEAIKRYEAAEAGGGSAPDGSESTVGLVSVDVASGKANEDNPSRLVNADEDGGAAGQAEFRAEAGQPAKETPDENEGSAGQSEHRAEASPTAKESPDENEDAAGQSQFNAEDEPTAQGTANVREGSAAQPEFQYAYDEGAGGYDGIAAYDAELRDGFFDGQDTEVRAKVSDADAPATAASKEENEALEAELAAIVREGIEELVAEGYGDVMSGQAEIYGVAADSGEEKNEAPGAAGGSGSGAEGNIAAAQGDDGNAKSVLEAGGIADGIAAAAVSGAQGVDGNINLIPDAGNADAGGDGAQDDFERTPSIVRDGSPEGTQNKDLSGTAGDSHVEQAGGKDAAAAVSYLKQAENGVGDQEGKAASGVADNSVKDRGSAGASSAAEDAEGVSGAAEEKGAASAAAGAAVGAAKSNTVLAGLFSRIRKLRRRGGDDSAATPEEKNSEGKISTLETQDVESHRNNAGAAPGENSGLATAAEGAVSDESVAASAEGAEDTGKVAAAAEGSVSDERAPANAEGAEGTGEIAVAAEGAASDESVAASAEGAEGTGKVAAAAEGVDSAERAPANAVGAEASKNIAESAEAAAAAGNDSGNAEGSEAAKPGSDEMPEAAFSADESIEGQGLLAKEAAEVFSASEYRFVKSGSVKGLAFLGDGFYSWGDGAARIRRSGADGADAAKNAKRRRTDGNAAEKSRDAAIKEAGESSAAPAIKDASESSAAPAIKEAGESSAAAAVKGAGESIAAASAVTAAIGGAASLGAYGFKGTEASEKAAGAAASAGMSGFKDEESDAGTDAASGIGGTGAAGRAEEDVAAGTDAASGIGGTGTAGRADERGVAAGTDAASGIGGTGAASEATAAANAESAQDDAAQELKQGGAADPSELWSGENDALLRSEDGEASDEVFKTEEMLAKEELEELTEIVRAGLAEIPEEGAAKPTPARKKRRRRDFRSLDETGDLSHLRLARTSVDSNEQIKDAVRRNSANAQQAEAMSAAEEALISELREENERLAGGGFGEAAPDGRSDAAETYGENPYTQADIEGIEEEIGGLGEVGYAGEYEGLDELDAVLAAGEGIFAGEGRGSGESEEEEDEEGSDGGVKGGLTDSGEGRGAAREAAGEEYFDGDARWEAMRQGKRVGRRSSKTAGRSWSAGGKTSEEEALRRLSEEDVASDKLSDEDRLINAVLEAGERDGAKYSPKSEDGRIKAGAGVESLRGYDSLEYSVAAEEAAARMGGALAARKAADGTNASAAGSAAAGNDASMADGSVGARADESDADGKGGTKSGASAAGSAAAGNDASMAGGRAGARADESAADGKDGTKSGASAAGSAAGGESVSEAGNGIGAGAAAGAEGAAASGSGAEADGAYAASKEAILAAVQKIEDSMDAGAGARGKKNKKKSKGKKGKRGKKNQKAGAAVERKEVGGAGKAVAGPSRGDEAQAGSDGSTQRRYLTGLRSEKGAAKAGTAGAAGTFEGAGAAGEKAAGTAGAEDAGAAGFFEGAGTAGAAGTFEGAGAAGEKAAGTSGAEDAGAAGFFEGAGTAGAAGAFEGAEAGGGDERKYDAASALNGTEAGAGAESADDAKSGGQNSFGGAKAGARNGSDAVDYLDGSRQGVPSGEGKERTAGAGLGKAFSKAAEKAKAFISTKEGKRSIIGALAAVLIIVVVAIFAHKETYKDVSLGEIRETLSGSEYMAGMTAKTASELKSLYGILSMTTDGFALYQGEDSAAEVLAVKAKSAAKAEAVAAKMKLRFEAIKEEYAGKGYDALFDDARVKTYGKYAIFILADNASAIQKEFQNLIEDD